MNNDKVVFAIVFVMFGLLFIAGAVFGVHCEHEKQMDWATENGWAHYNSATGELILHDLEYQKEVVNKYFNDEGILDFPQPARDKVI